MSTPVKVIKVRWIDSWYPEDGAYELIDIDTSTPNIMVGVGILADETEHAVLLVSAQHETDENRVINPLLIPKIAIVEQEEI